MVNIRKVQLHLDYTVHMLGKYTYNTMAGIVVNIFDKYNKIFK